MHSGLESAEAALDRGDYAQSLTLLDALAKKYPPTNQEGARIGMLMVTALIGQGDNEKAISTCRQITRCKDKQLSESAKQILSILEAPSLDRPANWSIQLPNLELAEETEQSLYQSRRRSTKITNSSPPPTGPTRNLGFGFSSLVLVILIAITILLSGCIRITTEISLPGPDRVHLSWEVESKNKQLLPWQIQFEEALKKLVPNVEILTNLEGMQRIKAPLLRSKEAILVLQHTIDTAAKTAGLETSPPKFSLNEKNWGIGVQQDLKLVVDLRALPEVPGLTLSVLVKPAQNANDIHSSPRSTSKDGAVINWPIQQGRMNQLELHNWHWNPLGVGSLLVMAILGIAILLQKIRLQMGFGFPELPP